MKEGDGYYLFVVNTKDGTLAGASFQINLVEKPSTIETLFEGDRQVDVINGSFTDNFGVYEVHVYYWDKSNVDDDGDGFSEDQGDCNDGDPNINPGADEVCDDGIDNNCDGDIDEGCDQAADGGGGGGCFIGTAAIGPFMNPAFE
jgi:hypothetical protein